MAKTVLNENKPKDLTICYIGEEETLHPIMGDEK